MMMHDQFNGLSIQVLQYLQAQSQKFHKKSDWYPKEIQKITQKI